MEEGFWRGDGSLDGLGQPRVAVDRGEAARDHRAPGVDGATDPAAGLGDEFAARAAGVRDPVPASATRSGTMGHRRRAARSKGGPPPRSWIEAGRACGGRPRPSRPTLARRLRPSIVLPASWPRGPALSRALTLGRSITAAAGLASRPALSRFGMTRWWFTLANPPAAGHRANRRWRARHGGEPAGRRRRAQHTEHRVAGLAQRPGAPGRQRRGSSRRHSASVRSRAWRRLPRRCSRRVVGGHIALFGHGPATGSEHEATGPSGPQPLIPKAFRRRLR